MKIKGGKQCVNKYLSILTSLCNRTEEFSCDTMKNENKPKDVTFSRILGKLTEFCGNKDTITKTPSIFNISINITRIFKGIIYTCLTSKSNTRNNLTRGKIQLRSNRRQCYGMVV